MSVAVSVQSIFSSLSATPTALSTLMCRANRNVFNGRLKVAYSFGQDPEDCSIRLDRQQKTPTAAAISVQAKSVAFLYCSVCRCGDTASCWYVLLSGSVIVDELMHTARHSWVWRHFRSGGLSDRFTDL